MQIHRKQIHNIQYNSGLTISYSAFMAKQRPFVLTDVISIYDKIVIFM